MAEVAEVATVKGACGHEWEITREQVIAGTWQTCPTCELERLVCELERLAAAERERLALVRDDPK